MGILTVRMTGSAGLLAGSTKKRTSSSGVTALEEMPVNVMFSGICGPESVMI
jgi:hypothetical protein